MIKQWWTSATRITWTPGIQALVEEGYCSATHIAHCISRHYKGDWGVMDDEDMQTNDQAVKYGGRVLSAYPIDLSQPCRGHGPNTIWVITEADRSITTVLLPSEY